MALKERKRRLTCSGNKGSTREQVPPWSQSPPSKCRGDCVRKNLMAPSRDLLWMYSTYNVHKNTSIDHTIYDNTISPQKIDQTTGLLIDD